MHRDEPRLREELADHLARLAADFERQGLSPSAARRAARLKLGGEDQIRVLWRDARRWNWLDHWLRDLRLALRSLRRSPGYAAAVILTLALAIAANTVIFSAVDAFLLRPLPYAQTQRLMQIYGAPRPGETMDLSFPLFEAWRTENHSFTAMTAVSEGATDSVLTGRGGAIHLAGEVVSPGALSMLGARPAAGRFFLPDEARPYADGGTDAIVISHGLFASRFAGDRSVLGRVIHLSGRQYTVVGVAPPGFLFPLGSKTDFWITTAAFREPRPGFPHGQDTRGWLFLRAVGRLRPGVSVAAARRDLDHIAAAYRSKRRRGATYPDASIMPLQAALTEPIRPLLDLLWAGAALVLFIACANLAALVTARTLSQLPGLRTRVALGAQLRDLLRSLLGETTILAAAGCALGWLLAAAVIGRLNGWLGSPGFHIRADAVLLAYAGVLGAAVVVLVGCWPAWAAARSAACCHNPRVTCSCSPQRSRSVLVAAEIALALLLVSTAGLFGRTFYKLAKLDPGFNARHVLVASLNLPSTLPPAERQPQFSELLQRVRSLPGVTAAGAGARVPWSAFGWGEMSGGVAGKTIPAPFFLRYAPATPGYFRALQMPLRGRGFTTADSAGAAPVVVVNQSFVEHARRSMPSFPANPIGLSIRLAGPTEPWRTVVGVVATVVMPGRRPVPYVYLPYAQAHQQEMYILVRAQGSPMALLPALNKQLAAVDPDLAFGNARPLTADRSNWAMQPEMAAWFAGAFAGLALLLAMTGLYGLTAYAVRQRERELSVRVALGAHRRDIYRLILWLAVRLTAVGLACGALGVYFMRGLLGAQLYHLSPLDPAMLAAAAALLATAALLAAFWPARRAARADPMRALRTE